MSDSTQEGWQHVVEQAVQRLRFGNVQITVHEGRVTLVESTEKVRLAPSSCTATTLAAGTPSLPAR